MPIRHFNCYICLFKYAYDISYNPFLTDYHYIRKCNICKTNICINCIDDIKKLLYFKYCKYCISYCSKDVCLSCQLNTNNQCIICNKIIIYKSHLSLLPIEILYIIFYLI